MYVIRKNHPTQSAKSGFWKSPFSSSNLIRPTFSIRADSWLGRWFPKTGDGVTRSPPNIPFRLRAQVDALRPLTCWSSRWILFLSKPHITFPERFSRIAGFETTIREECSTILSDIWVYAEVWYSQHGGGIWGIPSPWRLVPAEKIISTGVGEGTGQPYVGI